MSLNEPERACGEWRGREGGKNGEEGGTFGAKAPRRQGAKIRPDPAHVEGGRQKDASPHAERDCRGQLDARGIHRGRIAQYVTLSSCF